MASLAPVDAAEVGAQVFAVIGAITAPCSKVGLGFGLRASGFGLRASGFGLRASGFGLRASGLGFRGTGGVSG